MGMFSSSIPNDNSSSSGIFAFIDSLAGKALQGYAVSEGATSVTVQDKNVYQNTTTPGRSSLAFFGGMSTGEVLVLAVLFIVIIALILKGK